MEVSNRIHENLMVRRENGNVSATVVNVYGNVYVEVQGEGDHPQTRRARARQTVRSVLGSEWDVLEYMGTRLMTHCSSKGEVYGSMHRYSAVRIG